MTELEEILEVRQSFILICQVTEFRPGETWHCSSSGLLIQCSHCTEEQRHCSSSSFSTVSPINSMQKKKKSDVHEDLGPTPKWSWESLEVHKESICSPCLKSVASIWAYCMGMYCILLLNLHAQLCTVFLFCRMRPILWWDHLCSSPPNPKCMRQHYEDLRYYQCHISEYDCTQMPTGIFLFFSFQCENRTWMKI